jgi:hypothetical protein
MVNSRIELDEANKQIVSIRSDCGNGHTQLLSPQRLKEMVIWMSIITQVNTMN